jgi:uncharacterized protein YrrD
MLFLARHAYGALVDASDGKLGKLSDLVFHDQTWDIQSLVLDAGTWLHSRRVTLPPDLIRHKNWADHRLLVEGLTRQQVLDSPGTQTHIPVGAPPNVEEATIVDWDVYWIDNMVHPWQVSDDPHLRNSREVAGYHIQATDGALGHVMDFVVTDEAWKVRFLLVDTRNWWPGMHVLIAPSQIEAIVGEERVVRLSISRDAVGQSRPYDDSKPLEEPQTAVQHRTAPPFRHGRHIV